MKKKLIFKIDVGIEIEDGEEIDVVSVVFNEDNLTSYLTKADPKLILKALKAFKKTLKQIDRDIEVETRVEDMIQRSDN